MKTSNRSALIDIAAMENCWCGSIASARNRPLRHLYRCDRLRLIMTSRALLHRIRAVHHLTVSRFPVMTAALPAEKPWGTLCFCWGASRCQGESRYFAAFGRRPKADGRR